MTLAKFVDHKGRQVAVCVDAVTAVRESRRKGAEPLFRVYTLEGRSVLVQAASIEDVVARLKA
jgi:hypothetical protein